MGAASAVMLYLEAYRRSKRQPETKPLPVHCKVPSKVRHKETGCELTFNGNEYYGFYEKNGLRYTLRFGFDEVDKFDFDKNFIVIDNTQSIVR